jgi:hypothetical protein
VSPGSAWTRCWSERRRRRRPGPGAAAAGFRTGRGAEGTDDAGMRGTWVTWGANGDTAFLPGVTGVGVDALLV